MVVLRFQRGCIHRHRAYRVPKQNQPKKVADSTKYPVEGIRSGFAARLRAERESLGLSQVEMSERCGVSEASLWNFEREKSGPSVERLIAIAVAIDRSAEWLLTGQGPARRGDLIAFGEVVAGLDRREVAAAIEELRNPVERGMPPEEELAILESEIADLRERMRGVGRSSRAAMAGAIEELEAQCRRLRGETAEEGRQVTFVEPPVQREGYVEQVYRTKEVRPEKPRGGGSRRRRAEGE